jgi:hypothetical protein
MCSMFTLHLGIAIQRQQRQFERQIALRMRIQKVLTLANQFPRDRGLQRTLNHNIDSETQQKLVKGKCEERHYVYIFSCSTKFNT